MRLLGGGHVEMLGWKAVSWEEGLQECGAACRAAGLRGWMLGCGAGELKVGRSVGMRSCRAGRRCWDAGRDAGRRAGSGSGGGGRPLLSVPRRRPGASRERSRAVALPVPAAGRRGASLASERASP